MAGFPQTTLLKRFQPWSVSSTDYARPLLHLWLLEPVTALQQIPKQTSEFVYLLVLGDKGQQSVSSG